MAQATRDIVCAPHAERGEQDLGAVLQSCLCPSESAGREAARREDALPLVQGHLSREGPDIAFPDKADVDACFARRMKVPLDSGVYHGIATHEERPANLAFVVRWVATPARRVT